MTGAYETHTLIKTKRTGDGTYTDVIEFNVNKATGKAVIAKACQWKRVANGEQDNGSDVFGQDTVTVTAARKQYGQYLRMGYTATPTPFFIASL